MHVVDVVAWMIATPSFRTLRDLRIAVTHDEVNALQNLLRHWAICFLLEQHRYKTLQHLTLDLRFDDASDPHALKWSELDSALSDFMFSALKTLVVTLFPMYPEAEPVARLVGDELPRLLPWTAERDLFEILRLDRPTSSFFYWPGPLDWMTITFSSALRHGNTCLCLQNVGEGFNQALPNGLPAKQATFQGSTRPYRQTTLWRRQRTQATNL
ncbi:hypothetical protein R3P38DRAFT_3493110 [Favolaschia claudopus]|uniref:Uncharacterized protein n=1 Tax=Favolaschia claudopus TaxID=2862362 RepID=A0AAW0C882_9AGAR